MKLSERRTRMLHTLGLTWLKAPEAVVKAAPVAAPSPTAATRPAVPQKSTETPIFTPNQASPTVESASVATISAVIPEAVAQADWAGLQQMVSACHACGLCNSRRNTVFGEGAEPTVQQPRVMVIGEAPGENEDAQGRPFVGQAGQLLDAMLDAVGLSRSAEAKDAEQVFITNTLKCRPPGNRNPEPVELAACDGYLLRQIQLLKPQVIFALGRFAITQTLRDPDLVAQPVGKLRGRSYAVELAGHKAQVIVSYHPSYLLRSPAEKARAWEDLVLLADTLDSLDNKDNKA
jgi:uracil-DNA glycosylase